MEKVLAVIPARGGSTELRRKNLLPDSNGIPLVLASARAARDAGCTVVVSTDDAEVASLATIDGHQVHRRDGNDALNDGPVDLVVHNVIDQMRHTGGHDGPVLLVQPTVQPITAELLAWFEREAAIDDRSPAVLGVEDRHLIWADVGVRYRNPEGEFTLLTDRAERTSQLPWPIREMGVRWWPAGATPSQDQPTRVIAAPHHLVDIDTAADYGQIAKRLRIGFIIRANKAIGTGHLHRALTLAEGLQHHIVDIATTADTDQRYRDLIMERGWHHPEPEADVGVYDVLDTTPDDYRTGVPTVTLEDQGNAARQATAVINAMYAGMYAGIAHTGAKYAVLRPEFTIGSFHVKQDANRVLLLFGGTDPSNLTGLAEFAAQQWDVDIIHPGDERSVTAAMHDADLLITSGGRTVFEAAAVGLPTIVLCQNMRETTHTHLGVGNVNMGLGRLVDPDRLTYVVQQTLEDYELRRDMSAVGSESIDGYGAARVRRIIEHVGLYGEAP